MRMSRILSALALTLAVALGAAACGSDSKGGSGSSDPVVVEVSIADGNVVPNGERVEVAVDQPVTFKIDSDVPGGMHVHSSPEQEFEFEAGTSEHEITIDKPGVVEVELHDPARMVVQLEVR